MIVCFSILRGRVHITLHILHTVLECTLLNLYENMCVCNFSLTPLDKCIIL